MSLLDLLRQQDQMRYPEATERQMQGVDIQGNVPGGMQPSGFIRNPGDIGPENKIAEIQAIEDKQKELAIMSATSPGMSQGLSTLNEMLERQKLKLTMGHYISLTEDGIVGKDPQQDMAIASQLGIEPKIIERMAMLGAEKKRLAQETTQHETSAQAAKRGDLLRLLQMQGITPSEEESKLLGGGVQPNVPIEAPISSEIELFAKKGSEKLKEFYKVADVKNTKISIDESRGLVLAIDHQGNIIGKKQYAAPKPVGGEGGNKEDRKEMNKRIDAYNHYISELNKTQQVYQANLAANAGIDPAQQTILLKNRDASVNAEKEATWTRFFPGIEKPKFIGDMFMDVSLLGQITKQTKVEKNKEEQRKQQEINKLKKKFRSKKNLPGPQSYTE